MPARTGFAAIEAMNPPRPRSCTVRVPGYRNVRPRVLSDCRKICMASVLLDWQTEPPANCRGGVVTIGNFDGVHRGHAALVAETRHQARLLRGPAVALTFDPHPLDLLRPESAQPVLTT